MEASCCEDWKYWRFSPLCSALCQRPLPNPFAVIQSYFCRLSLRNRFRVHLDHSVMLSDLLSGTTATGERVRIVVEPLEPDTPYWAFVSITNNETQHITISTPKTPFQVAAPAN
jgi:hypothetical protein